MAMLKIKASIHILAAWAALNMPTFAQEVDSTYLELSVGITGANTLTGLNDPITVLRMTAVSHLMQDIADAPRDKTFIRNALKGSEADLDTLVSLGLIRERDGAYVINFPYFTKEDHELFISALDPYANYLVAEYEDNWRQFEEIFSQYDVESVQQGAIAYAILGAFSLDWDGLTITAERNYRVTADNMPLGFDFIPWAKEQASPESLKGIYWGSHNAIYDGMRFVTFGDHVPRARGGFPDYIWSVNGAIRRMRGDISDLSRATQRALQPYYQTDAMTDIGNILFAMRNGAATREEIAGQSGVDPGRVENLLSLLEGLNYVRQLGDRFDLIIPVFDAQDYAMLRAARDLSNKIIIDHLSVHYAPAKSALGALSGVQNGTPYEQLYTQGWHYLFGLVNRKLAQKGYFIDPYAQSRDYVGFAPFVFKTSIYDSDIVVSADQD